MAPRRAAHAARVHLEAAGVQRDFASASSPCHAVIRSAVPLW